MTYTIKDVAEKTGLSIHAIRFYDKEGLIPFVARNKSGIRIFTDSDIFLIQTICYLKDTGMAVKNIKKYVEYVIRGPVTIEARKELFQAHRSEVAKKIEELKKNLKQIDMKLKIYNAPNAEEIITKQIKYINKEKSGYGLVSQFAALDLAD